MPTSYTYSNGLTNSITYNSRNFTTRITAGTALDVGYGYDSRGNTSPITNYLDTTKNQSFTYDSLSRVTGFNGAWGTGSYSYDSTGNRQTKTVAGVSTSYSYSSNRLGSTSGGKSLTFSYNGYGSLTGTTCSGGNTLTYDMLNNLKEYKFGAYPLASFAYDGDGMRVTKTTWKTMVYHYDKDGKTLSETDSNGNLIADNIYLNGKLVAKAEPSALYFYHTDPAGTALAMTNTSGSVVWKTDYKPFGEEQSITGTIENNEKFTGKEKDKETGLYYFGARYLGPKIGRFVTVDPAGITEKDLLNPQKLNRYAYSLNNPYRYIDPDGKWPTPVHNTIIERAFSRGTYKLSTSAVAALQRGSRLADSLQYQDTEHSYMHAMRDASITPNQTAAQAEILMNNYIRGKVNDYKTLMKKGDTKAAYEALGMAMHPLMDATSPAHEGFQGWGSPYAHPIDAYKHANNESEGVFNANPNYSTRAVDSIRKVYDEANKQRCQVEYHKRFTEESNIYIMYSFPTIAC